ncbi:type IX secretion system periplasmic lipoprotein PorW/SprE [Pedobacter sp.]
MANRKLQNLSARYNLIYNSNVLMDDYLEGINQSNKENFDSFLPIYYAPPMAEVATAGIKVKQLDEIDQKARTIIAEKNFSNYIDDAYILLGKTNFYQGKYYNANAYFDYVAKTYQKNHKIYLNALTWKARSLLQLDDVDGAAKIIDTVKIELDSVKRGKAEALATIAQFNMIKGDEPQAINYLEKALKVGTNTLNKIHWTYTLAQLYENQKLYDKSLASYRKVEKSNAAFDMYFNAKLSRIRVSEQINGKDFDRNSALLKMLKDDKNTDFKDQIYYEIADDYYANNEFGKAEEYYNLSIRNSTTNNVQKALSYLKIADLNFKNYNDYVAAKQYYDSTALTLPKTHPLYNSIANKAQNLAYLQQRYEAIALQDTLQRIALLPAGERPLALSNYFTALEQPKLSVNNGSSTVGQQSTRTGGTSFSSGNSSFYFANANAISRGFNEFKKRWGNRKLTPNWRQSNKSSQEQTEAAIAVNDGIGALPQNPDNAQSTPSTNKSTLYLDSLPLTPYQLEISNQKLINAYLEMGSFYQQVLNDKPEAIKTYQVLLKRFPNNNKLDMIYYSLYLANQGTDSRKTEEYKNLVLSKYPNSVYAKTILDPNFSAKQNQLEATLNREYEALFGKLQEKEFNNVITGVNAINQRFPGNVMEAQYAYLKSIAIGRTENVDRLLAAFAEIAEKYKTDKLIKPLVDQHIIYINAHLSEFKKRKIALLSYDPNELPFAENKTGIRINEPIIANVLDPSGNKKIYVAPPLEKLIEKPQVKEPVVAKAEPKPEPKEPIKEVKKEPVVTPIEKKKDSVIVKVPEVKKDSVIIATVPKKDTVAIPATKTEPVKETLFNPASSKNYYVVVAVNTTSVNVSSSRFGIGQFNRGNYAGNNLRHQLKELDQDQLIIVGDFNSITEVQQYYQNIKPQLGRIMKVPAANYTTFAISKENLEKIINRDTLERYIRYISNNEL